MQQLELMHESINDALVFIVQALGGAKKVGSMMRPEMPADHAATWVRDCLNPSRREHFDPDHVVLLLRAARQAGVHSGMQYLSTECGYCGTTPREPDDEKAELMREFIAAEQRMAKLASKMERIGLIRSAA